MHVLVIQFKFEIIWAMALTHLFVKLKGLLMFGDSESWFNSVTSDLLTVVDEIKKQWDLYVIGNNFVILEQPS